MVLLLAHYHIVDWYSWYVLLQHPFLHEEASIHLPDHLIYDLSYFIYSSDFSVLILVLISAVFLLLYPCRCWTLESSIFFSEDIVFASTCKSATPIIISFSSCVRRYICCFLWSFAALKLSALTWLVFFASTEFSMDDTASTIFASFAWHRLISIFVERLSMRLWSWY